MSMRSFASMKRPLQGFNYEDGNESIQTIREDFMATKAMNNIDYTGGKHDYRNNHMFESDISS